MFYFRIVDALIQNLDRHFPDMKIDLTRPFGSPAVLQVTSNLLSNNITFIFDRIRSFDDNLLLI